YQLLKTTKHSLTIIGCCILSSIVVISGQFITEHVFNFSTEISIIINFIGGIYFLYLILKSRRKV
ncbi:MAG TPA: iron chelate uptake ABC transporter family permease subunit, partial [Candidatus Sphingobacterium stercoripullorum]|nr:iron chelate uptake ABC transporter family permease subunit [Candidatus Sphingobacterium stercoripullorum]